MTTIQGSKGTATPTEAPSRTRSYVLYARKSSEQDEKQARSIEGQINEMERIAKRERLHIVEVKREAHSAKASGTRPVFNEVLDGIQNGTYDAILTWAPDRLSRNAGDLGSLVDLMDQGHLKEIRTYGQTFADNPDAKFLLMILCSQAKLENDNRGVNVSRGLRARVEAGLWPGMAPLGYLNEKRTDRKCEILVDKERAPIVRQIFKKAGNDGWSGRKICRWLKETEFTTRGEKPLTLSGIYRILTNPFYHGIFEYPKGSGNWYRGRHTPLISEDLFRKVHIHLKREETRRNMSEFAFTKLISCCLCGSPVSAERKQVQRKDGTTTQCIYYGCMRTRDRGCRNKYLKEDEFMGSIAKIADSIAWNETGIRMQCEEEVKRLVHLTKTSGGKGNTGIDPSTIDPKEYAKHILAHGSSSERRILLSHLRTMLVMENKTIAIAKS